MARTKEEMAEILADRKKAEFMAGSTWNDLVAAVQAATPAQRTKLIKVLREGNRKEAGTILHKALLENARGRAKAHVDAMLADNSIDMLELDELL